MAWSFSRYLHDLANHTWLNMRAADGFGLPLNEETITEALALTLAGDFDPSFLKVRAFNKYEEGGVKNPKPTGADWEVWVETPTGKGITLRFQAKRIFWSPKKHNAKYDGIDAAKAQTTNLIKNTGSAIPLYLFYNWQPEPGFNPHAKKRFPHASWACKSKYRMVEDWGVSVTPAFGVVSKTKPKPEDIAIMRPWGCIACSCTSALSDPTLAGRLGASLRHLFTDLTIAQDRQEDLSKISFEPSKTKPRWAEIIERERPAGVIPDRDGLREELARLGLDAVVHMQQTRPFERRE